jgi:hypothetical protein
MISSRYLVGLVVKAIRVRDKSKKPEVKKEWGRTTPRKRSHDASTCELGYMT